MDNVTSKFAETASAPDQCKPIPGFAHYWARSDGHVYSTHSGEPRRLSPRSDHNGYLVVSLRGEAPKRKQVPVHRAVALAFHGQPPQGHEVRHLDGNKTNNAASNLAWGTHVENMTDRTRHGTVVRGERHHASRFTADDVVRIREAHASGQSQYSLAKKYGVSKMAIWQIVRGKVWAHVA